MQSHVPTIPQPRAEVWRIRYGAIIGRVMRGNQYERLFSGPLRLIWLGLTRLQNIWLTAKSP